MHRSFINNFHRAYPNLKRKSCFVYNPIGGVNVDENRGISGDIKGDLESPLGPAFNPRQNKRSRGITTINWNMQSSFPITSLIIAHLWNEMNSPLINLKTLKNLLTQK